MMVNQLEHQRCLSDSAPSGKCDCAVVSGDHACVKPGLTERQLSKLDRRDQRSVHGVFGHSVDSREIVDVPEPVVQVPDRCAWFFLRGDSDDPRIRAQSDPDQPTLDHEPSAAHDVLLEMNAACWRRDVAEHQMQLAAPGPVARGEVRQLALEIGGHWGFALQRDG